MKSTIRSFFALILVFTGINTITAQDIEINPDEDNIIYVNQQVSGGTEDGSSWDNAVPELAQAYYWISTQMVDSTVTWDAQDPLKVWVAGNENFEETVYVPVLPSIPDVLDPGDPLNHFSIPKNVHLYGGFPANATAGTDFEDRDPATHATILAGNVGNGEQAEHVVVSVFDVENAVFDGFVISNGAADGAGSVSFTESPESGAPSVSVASNKGAGIYIADSSPVLRNLFILDNTAEDGAGIYVQNASPEIVNTVFRSNEASSVSGGLYVDENSTADITNAVFSDNIDADSAGAFFNAGELNMTNTIAWRNEQTIFANNQMDAGAMAATNISYSIIEAGCDENFTCDNIIANNPRMNSPADFDFRLSETSPAINNGDPDTDLSLFGASSSEATDFSGKDRNYNNGTIDIGAFEYQSTPNYPFAAGDGSEEDPFQITTLTELQAAQEYPYAHFELMNNIDASATQNWNDGEGFVPIGYGQGSSALNVFNGEFDGRDHTIDGLHINRPGSGYQGLFSIIGKPATVRSLNLANVNIVSMSRSGAIAGYNNGNMIAVTADGTVEGISFLGGLAGVNEAHGEMESVAYSGEVITDDTNSIEVGGITGMNHNVIQNAVMSGTVLSQNGINTMGGITGTNEQDGDIRSSSNTGNVTAETADSEYIGGIAGENRGRIRVSWNTGTIEGGTSIGGLVGHSRSEDTGDEASVERSYSRGEVISNSSSVAYAGGIVGYLHSGMIEETYSTTPVSSTTGQSDVGGIVGGILIGADYTLTASYWDTEASGLNKTADDEGTGLTTAEMKSIDSHSSWDINSFFSTWKIENNLSYPFLQNNPEDSIPGFHNPFAGGTGIRTDPFEIETLEQLQAMADSPQSHYILKNDIDASPTANWNQDNGTYKGFEPIGTPGTPFSGMFNGNGHKITGLTIHRPGTMGVGLFGATSSSAIIHTLALEDVSITGDNLVGGLVGDNEGEISTVYVLGEVHGEGSQIGGLAGNSSNSTIKNTYTMADVSGDSEVGGLVGFFQSSYGSQSEIVKSYSASSVEGNSSLGGLIGSGSNNVTRSIWNNDLADQSTSGYGSSTPQMLQKDRYVRPNYPSDDDWDFEHTWAMTENETYPWLRQLPQVPAPAPDTLPAVLKDTPCDSCSVTLPLTFEWESFPGATSYTLQVTSDYTWDTITFDTTVTGQTSADLRKVIPQGTGYYWRVKANNSIFSNFHNFWMENLTAPDATQLIQPETNTSITETPILLKWKQTKRAFNYQVQVAKDDAFNSIVTDQTVQDTTYSLQNLEHSSSYFWRVQAVNPEGEGAWSSTFSFSTTMPVPETPHVIHPENNEGQLSTSLTFDWNETDHTESYIFQLAEDAEFENTLIDSAGHSSTTLATSSLAYATTYYWRVKALNADTSGNWSDVFTFETRAPDASVPKLASPENASSNTDTLLTFSWNEAENARSYQFVLSDDSKFESIIADSSEHEGTSLNIFNLKKGTTYYWKVRAFGQTDTTSWSSTYRFTTKYTPTKNPKLVSPKNGSEDTDTTLTFDWAEAENALVYQFQLAHDAEFSSLLRDTSAIQNTQVNAHNLERANTYYWRVRAFGETDTTSWTEAFHFTTQPPENKPPLVVNAPGYISLQEDFGTTHAAAFDTVFTDPEEAKLEYEIVRFDTTLFQATLAKDTLRLQSNLNQYGSGSVIVQATDPENAYATDTLNIDIEAVNDLPQFTEIPDTLAFRSDEELSVELDTSVTDVEDDVSELDLKASAQPEELLLEVDEDAMTATLSAPEFSGEGSITLSVTDTDGGTTEETIIVVVERATSNELGQEIPKEFALDQNYPNPFNPSTVIRYHLPHKSEVRLEVFDITGRKVATLLHGETKPAGIYQATFGARNLASGIYIYRLQAGSNVFTKKLTLIK